MRLVRWLSRWRARSLRRLSQWTGAEIDKAVDTETMWDGARLAYRLQSWPHLRTAHQTAAIYGALSVMTTRPVSVGWFSRRCGLRTHQAQRILDWLVAQGYAQELVLPRVRGTEVLQ